MTIKKPMTVGELKVAKSRNFKKKTVTKTKNMNMARPNSKSPMLRQNQFNDIKENANSDVLLLQIELMNLPAIDMNNPDEVANQIAKYFKLYNKYDVKPTVTGLALALNGMHRHTLWAIVNNQPTGSGGVYTKLPKDVTHLIKKAYRILDNMYEIYMNSGKINPVAGIFLGKNNHGYKDSNEMVLTPNTNDSSDYSADDIRARYQAPKQISNDSSDSDTEEI